jgi:hypothetical protein
LENPQIFHTFVFRVSIKYLIVLKSRRNLNQVSNGQLKTADGRVVYFNKKHIKPIAGLFSIANKRGCAADFSFYFQVVAVTESDNSLKRNEWFKLSDAFGYTESTLYGKFSRLLKIGYCVKGGDSYKLISHDNLAIKLGLDLTKTHKYYKIDIQEVIKNGIQNTIALFETEFNFKKQLFMEMKKCFKTKRPIRRSNSVHDRLAYFNAKKAYIEVKKAFIENFHPQISLLRLARLLGFSSSSTGFEILKQLEQFGLIEVLHRQDSSGRNLCNYITIINNRMTS